MTRTELHAKALHWAAGMAKRRGRTLTGCAVKAGVPRLAPHIVTVRGKRYRYVYEHLGFSLHRHGKVVKQPRLWLLIQWPKRQVWVIPARVLGRIKTVTVHTRLPNHAARNRIDPWIGRWDLLKLKARHA